MRTYNYQEAVKEDIKDYIKSNFDSFDDFDRDRLEEDLWVEDSVTGNASGSYTCNSSQAHEYLINNEDLFIEAAEEFGCDGDTIKEHFTDYEWQDVTIRCYLLNQCLTEALEELEDEGWGKTEDEDEE